MYNNQLLAKALSEMTNLCKLDLVMLLQLAPGLCLQINQKFGNPTETRWS